ncbi:MAG: site-specific integrase [Chloroflexota bacterium]|nr:site-specific integrase [Chloroflexota bacterium]
MHAIPALGRHQLDKLAPQHVAELLKTKQQAGLSPRRVHHIRAVVRTALNQALRWGLVTGNAAALVDPPRQTAPEVDPFSPAQARAALAAAEADRLGTLFRLALTLGLRQGEVLGLRWADVDLEAGVIRVRHSLQRIDGALILKEPKTEKSRRTLHLPLSLVVALRSHRVAQLEERLLAGDRWQERDFVFTTRTGTPLDARNVIRSWHRLLAKAGIERRPFHTCRHTAASLLLAEGVPVKVVQEVLGHTLMSTTADIYGHLFPGAFREVADAMERALAG